MINRKVIDGQCGYGEGPLDHVQTNARLKHCSTRLGALLKRFGQHFLIDGNLMRRLVESADLKSDDVVLEVGPARAV
jgi:hypothetical protein